MVVQECGSAARTATTSWSSSAGENRGMPVVSCGSQPYAAAAAVQLSRMITLQPCCAKNCGGSSVQGESIQFFNNSIFQFFQQDCNSCVWRSPHHSQPGTHPSHGY
jgi:hypothetical protein